MHEDRTSEEWLITVVCYAVSSNLVPTAVFVTTVEFLVFPDRVIADGVITGKWGHQSFRCAWLRRVFQNFLIVPDVALLSAFVYKPDLMMPRLAAIWTGNGIAEPRQA